MDSKMILRYRLGEQEWQEYEFTTTNLVLGRGEDCDLILDHREVSRRHVRISRMGDQLMITDLGSSNGTTVEGQLLEANSPFALNPGAIFMVGGFTLTVNVPGAVETYVAADEQPELKESYQLKYRRDKGNWQTYTLPAGETTIGRGSDNDLSLDDDEASRYHAKIGVEGGDVWVTDLGSTNGTEIDGVLLSAQQKQLLRMGQFLTIGRFTLYIESPQSVGVMHSASGTMVMPGPAFALPAQDSPHTMLDAEMPTSTDPVRTMNLANQEKVTIGRDVENSVVLNHPLISRYHAVLEKMGKRYVIKDLRSTNGVFVNEERIEKERYLKDWDQIRIGSYVFVISGQHLQGQIEQGVQIEVRNVNQQVSSSLNLLKDISLTIDPNEFVALVGMSGAGKTTFMNAISGYWPASHGWVLVNGINLYDHYDLFRNDIGYVPQKDIVHAELTPELALDYVAQLRMPPDTSPGERRAVVSEVIKDLDSNRAQGYPHLALVRRSVETCLHWRRAADQAAPAVPG